MTSLWWTSSSHQQQQEKKEKKKDEEGEGVRRLDIQALFSHEGFLSFFKANANILASVWNYLKFNFTLLLGWILNTLWSSPPFLLLFLIFNF
jgi:hypothetical protein